MTTYKRRGYVMYRNGHPYYVIPMRKRRTKPFNVAGVLVYVTIILCGVWFCLEYLTGAY